MRNNREEGVSNFYYYYKKNYKINATLLERKSDKMLIHTNLHKLKKKEKGIVMI